MTNSPLTDKVSIDRRAGLNMKNKVSKFINRTRGWELTELTGLLPKNIISSIRDIPIPISDVPDKMV